MEQQQPLWVQHEQASERYGGRSVSVSAGTPYWVHEGTVFKARHFAEDSVLLVDRVLLSPNTGESDLPDPVVDLFFYLRGETGVVHAHLVEPAGRDAQPRGRLSELAG